MKVGVRVGADGAVLVRGGRFAFGGPAGDLPAGDAAGAEPVDCGGRLVTPGLIDCHNHLVHGGERSNEFEMRLAGAAYEDIARAGGGIVSSVKATRAASDDDLLRGAAARLDRLIAEGVTTVEVKSGYGLDLPTEARMLRAARRLGEVRDVGVRTSFLGAHALPPEARGDKDRYSRLVADAMVPALAAEGLVDAVDGFCEGIAFSPDQIARVFDAAKGLGLPVKLPPPPTIWARRGPPPPWRGPARSRCCCPAPAISCARPTGRPSTLSAATAPAWRWRPTTTPAPLPSPRC